MAKVKIISIDNYEGETEDILKKIAEAGEMPKEDKATEKKTEDKDEESIKNLMKECDIAYYNFTFVSTAAVALSDVMSCESAKRLIDMGYCSAPASSKYHGNHPGGLFEHSMKVTEILCSLTMCKDLNIKWDRTESPVIIGLFHDLCKIDQYIVQPDGTYKFNTEGDTRHAEKSIEYIEKYTDIKLTEQEKMCILYHMGNFGGKDTEYRDAIKMCPNVLYTHMADMIASQIYNV